MKYSFKATHLEVAKDVADYIKKKLTALDRLAEHFGEAAEARVEVERMRHHKKGDVFRAEIRVHVPGKHLNAESEGTTAFEALDKVKDEIHRELERFKERDVDNKKRGARKIKKLLKGE
jgi:ribosomal subunit interface protein